MLLSRIAAAVQRGMPCAMVTQCPLSRCEGCHSRRCLSISSAISCSSSGKYFGSSSSFPSGQAAYISLDVPPISCGRLGNSLLSCEWASWGDAAAVWWLVVTKEGQQWLPCLAFIRWWTRNEFLRSCVHPTQHILSVQRRVSQPESQDSFGLMDSYRGLGKGSGKKRCENVNHKYGYKTLEWNTDISKMEYWAIEHFEILDFEIMPLFGHPRRLHRNRWITRNILKARNRQFRQKMKVPKV